jgi:amino acid adenylation domain-containing protein
MRADTRLHDLVLAQASATPDTVAVTIGPTSLTYRELVERSRRLARALLAAGAVPESFVGVVADRSIETILGFLGVLMSGAAYVPIAADLPRDRVHMIASAAGIRLVTGAAGPIPSMVSAQFVPVDEPPSGPEMHLPDIDPACPAYAIFTSGSTGRPKGVVVPHQAVVDSTLARFKVFRAESPTYLMLAPLTIDAAVAGLYFTFAARGRVVVPTAEEVLDPLLLAELAMREAVSHLDGLPSQYATLLRFHPEAMRAVRCVVLGGESLPKTVVRRHLEAAPRVALYNEYGPTECTVWSTVYRCTDREEGPLVPIGKPIEGVRVTVLDNDLRPTPAGVVGEVYISGEGLARCYLSEPSLTAERFIADPDPRYPGKRMYRTGDLGHVDPDGELVFHGRADHLVKVRGFRVEPAEVEARLLEHPGVLDAAVVAYEGTAGVRLAAIVAGSPGSRALSAFLADRLPPYMVPTVWRQVDVLPLGPGGKVDRLLLTSRAITVGSALPT